MAEELPLFLGLNDKTVTDIPKTVEKQRYMTSVAPKAANPGKWVEQPRMPIPTGEHAVIECQGKIHSIAGYAKHRVDQNFHQVYDPASKSWSLKAPFPHPCNHVAGVSIGTKIYTFGGFVEQNRCPHSKCFVYDTTTDQWAPIAPISRPRGADLGHRARRQNSSARRPRRALGRMARGLRSGDQQIFRSSPACAARPARSLSSASATTWASPWSTAKSTPSPAAWTAYDFNTGLNAVYDPKTDCMDLPRAAADAALAGRPASISTARSWCSAAKRPARCSAPTKPTIPRPTVGKHCTPMAIPRHGLHGATCAVIGNMVHVPGGGPVPGGQVQGAYHDAFTFG